LVKCYLQSLLELIFLDQFKKSCRTRHIRPLPDIDEVGGWRNGDPFQSA
jgi:hypothetical protein